MSSSNCCFLTCIQISQEAGQVVWYSYLFQNFPQFIVIHIVKGFGIVKKAEIDVFLELSCFFDDPVDVGNLISGFSAFSKTSLTIWKFMVHVLLRLTIPFASYSLGTSNKFLSFWMLSFKPTFSLSSFTLIKSLFSSLSHSAIKVVSSVYLILLMFLLTILIPACESSSLEFHGSHIAETWLGEFWALLYSRVLLLLSSFSCVQLCVTP